MKTLILFYSRTGITSKVANSLAVSLGADKEEVFSNINYSGVFGYIRAGKYTLSKKLTTIKPLIHNLSDYDLIIIGTPVWVGLMATPIRTLLTNYKEKMNQVALFCTQGATTTQGALLDMTKVLNKEIKATLEVSTKEVVNNNFNEKLNKFVNEINK
ncbi:MAG TPA: flavodoxin [bacterium]|nr:flavodoxin [bacterium]